MPVAQEAEHLTVNQKVEGSWPSGYAILQVRAKGKTKMLAWPSWLRHHSDKVEITGSFPVVSTMENKLTW